MTSVSRSSEVSTVSLGIENAMGVELGSKVGFDMLDATWVGVLLAVGEGSKVGMMKGLAAAVSFSQGQSLNKDGSDLDTNGT